MRADIHDGPEHMLQSETEYIDARPHQPAVDQSLLHRTAGPYIWVKRVILAVRRSLPVCPHKQTIPEPVGMSKRCHKRKSGRCCINCTTELQGCAAVRFAP